MASQINPDICRIVELANARICRSPRGRSDDDRSSFHSQLVRSCKGCCGSSYVTLATHAQGRL